MNHGVHFMAAIAFVWNERRQNKGPTRTKVCVYVFTRYAYGEDKLSFNVPLVAVGLGAGMGWVAEK